jgi:hypothetical protein
MGGPACRARPAVRVEQVRQIRAETAYWSGHALGQAIALLETGTPLGNHFECALTLTNGHEVRYFRIVYDRLNGNNWQVDVEPITSIGGLPLAPLSF